MPDNKSLQQQAKDYVKNRLELFEEISQRQYKLAVYTAYLAAATKYISEIEARDKKIEELSKSVDLLDHSIRNAEQRGVAKGIDSLLSELKILKSQNDQYREALGKTNKDFDFLYKEWRALKIKYEPSEFKERHEAIQQFLDNKKGE